MASSYQLDRGRGWSWLQPIPWSEFGAIFVGAGVLSIWVDHFFSREQDAMDEQRLRRLLHEQAPAMRDAVLEAFAANNEDLARVATPETLDQIIANSLARRLHDPQFASEIYNDIRDQAVSASERWHDASLSIDLSPLTQSVLAAASPLTHHQKPFFAVTVRWEYTAIPRHVQRRFVCLSDREEYAEMANARGDTSAWYLKPGSGLDVSSTEAFELLRFSVNGETRPIRRATRKTGQIYTATIGNEHVDVGQPVTISYTYRTITTQSQYRCHLVLSSPAVGSASGMA